MSPLMTLDSRGKKQANIISYSVRVTGNHLWLQPQKPTHTRSKRGCFHPSWLADSVAHSLEASSLSFCLFWTGLLRALQPQGTVVESWMTLAAGTRVVAFHHRMLGTKTSLVKTCVFSISFQSCGKERTASDRCQTNLLQLTCSATVEPSDPDLHGNHCKYFPVRLVEDSFNWASHRGIKLTVNDSKCLYFVSSVPKQ